MSEITTATIFIVTVNLLMFFSQIAMLDINPTGNTCYSIKDTIIDTHMQGSENLTTTDNDPFEQLPTEAGGSVEEGSTTVYTDSSNKILGWLKSTPGIKYVYGVASAPYNILTCLGLPPAFTAGIGTLWYLTSILVVVAFIWGRY